MRSTIKALVEISSLLFNAYFPFFDTIILRSNSNWQTPCCAIVDPLLKLKTPCIKLNCVFCCCHVLFSSRRILLTLGTNRAVHTNFSHAWNWKKLCFTWILIALNPSWIFTVCGCVCVHLLTGLAVQSVSQWSSVRPVQLAKSPGSIACIWPKSPRVSVGSQTWVTHCWHESFTYYFHGFIFLCV